MQFDQKIISLEYSVIHFNNTEFLKFYSTFHCLLIFILVFCLKEDYLIFLTARVVELEVAKYTFKGVAI